MCVCYIGHEEFYGNYFHFQFSATLLKIKKKYAQYVSRRTFYFKDSNLQFSYSQILFQFSIDILLQNLLLNLKK